MAGPGHHTVRIIRFHHHHTKGQIIFQQDLSGLLRCHPFIFSGLKQQIHVFIQLLRFLRINDLHAVQFHLQPAGTIHDLLFIPHHNNIGNPFFQNIGCRNQCPFIIGLRKHDCLSVTSGLLFHQINIRHSFILLFLSDKPPRLFFTPLSYKITGLGTRDFLDCLHKKTIQIYHFMLDCLQSIYRVKGKGYDHHENCRYYCGI